LGAKVTVVEFLEQHRRGRSTAKVAKQFQRSLENRPGLQARHKVTKADAKGKA